VRAAVAVETGNENAFEVKLDYHNSKMYFGYVQHILFRFDDFFIMCDLHTRDVSPIL
jgi:hypothetical protein